MSNKVNKKFDKELFFDAAKMVQRFDNAVKRHQNKDALMSRQSIDLRAESLELLLNYLADFGGKNVFVSYQKKMDFNVSNNLNVENIVFKPAYVAEIIEMIWRLNEGFKMHFKSQNNGEFAVNQYQKLRDERINLLLDYFVELGWNETLKAYFEKHLTLIPA